MVQISKGIIALILVIGAFLVADIFLIIETINGASNLSSCKNNQNTNCPTIMCNGDPGNQYQAPSQGSGTPAADKTTPGMCWPYAYREVKDNSGNILTYQCNYPFVGKQPLNAPSN